MQLETHVQALQAELAGLAAIGDEQVAAAADRLSQALASSLRLRLLELVSEAALEVSSQLRDGHVEVRLAGQEPSLVYVEHDEAAPPPAAEDGLTARITLRLPDSLKTSVEGAAAREGVSVNSWIVKALARGLTSAVDPSGRIGSRLTGYGES
jgi:predicted HicB family RNase H-like nuclease